MPRIPNVSPTKISPITIRALVRKPDPVILDIGANDGSSSLAFLEQMPEAQIFAFEPDTRAIQRFQNRPDSDRVSLTKAAVSATDGEMTFYCSGGLPNDDSRERLERRFPEGWDLSGSLRSPKEKKPPCPPPASTPGLKNWRNL